MRTTGQLSYCTDYRNNIFYLCDFVKIVVRLSRFFCNSIPVKDIGVTTIFLSCHILNKVVMFVAQ